MNNPFLKKINAWHFINKCFKFDRKKYIRYSHAITTAGEDHLLEQIMILTHVIEKGLTMPEMRQGFGQETVNKLILLCHRWSESHDIKNHFYIQAVQVILEYISLHKTLNYTFNEPFLSVLDSFANENTGFKPSVQLLFDNSQDYFSQKESSFPVFARSRHSVRNFSNEEVPVSSLVDAIELAQKAPSSCNRQTTRVHIVTDKTDIGKILSLQNGNRGFGHLINKLLVISYYTPFYGSVKERHLGYIDAGIFTMNLLYALHYNRIGACTLNWCDTPNEDAKIRSILHIEEKETITLLIACGMVPDHSFSVAKSQRIEGNAITIIHS